MILLDTNAIIYYLHRTEPYASRVKQTLMSKEDLAITLRIADEVLFTLIRLEAWRTHGIRKLNVLRDYIRKHGLKEFYNAINDFEEFVDKLGVQVLEDKGDLIELVETMIQFGLLPGDALIAATARHYNIESILTFDEDLRKIPWLKPLP